MPPLMHLGSRPVTDGQFVSPLFKFPLEISEFVRLCRIAVEHAPVIIGGTMLADMLVTSAVETLLISGEFGEKGEYDALKVDAEDDGRCWGHFQISSWLKNPPSGFGGLTSL